MSEKEVSMFGVSDDANLVDLRLQQIALHGEYGTDVARFYHESSQAHETGDDLRQWLLGLTVTRRYGYGDSFVQHIFDDASADFVIAGELHDESSLSLDYNTRDARLRFVYDHNDPFNLDKELKTVKDWEKAYKRKRRQDEGYSWYSPTDMDALSASTELHKFTAGGRKKDQLSKIAVLMTELALEQDDPVLASMFASKVEEAEQRINLYFDAQQYAGDAGRAVLGVYDSLEQELQQDSPSLIAGFKSRQIAETPQLVDGERLAEEVAILAGDERYCAYPSNRSLLLFETGVALARAGLPDRGRKFITKYFITSNKLHVEPAALSEQYDFQAQLARTASDGLLEKEARKLLRSTKRVFIPQAVLLLAVNGATDLIKLYGEDRSLQDPGVVNDALNGVARQKIKVGKKTQEVDVAEYQSYIHTVVDAYFPTARIEPDTSIAEQISAYAAVGDRSKAERMYHELTSDETVQVFDKFSAAAAMTAWFNAPEGIGELYSGILARLDVLQINLRNEAGGKSVVESSQAIQRYQNELGLLGQGAATIPDSQVRRSLQERMGRIQEQLRHL